MSDHARKTKAELVAELKGYEEKVGEAIRWLQSAQDKIAALEMHKDVLERTLHERHADGVKLAGLLADAWWVQAADALRNLAEPPLRPPPF